MTVRKAKEQLAQVIGYLHLSEDSFSITNGHLVSKDGVMDIPVKELQAIIPRHGTVMGILNKKEQIWFTRCIFAALCLGVWKTGNMKPLIFLKNHI